MTDYDDARLRRTLAEDVGIAELGIDVVTEDERIVLRGHVESPQRREAIERRVSASQPGREVVNEIIVVATDPPTHVEELS